MYPPILLITKFAVCNNEICIKNSYYTINFISISILYKKKKWLHRFRCKNYPTIKALKKTDTTKYIKLQIMGKLSTQYYSEKKNCQRSQ